MSVDDVFDFERELNEYKSPPPTPIRFVEDDKPSSPVKPKSKSSSSTPQISQTTQTPPPSRKLQFRHNNNRPYNELKKSAEHFYTLYQKFKKNMDSDIRRKFCSRYKYLVGVQIKRLDPHADKDKATKAENDKLVKEYVAALEFIRTVPEKIALARRIPRASNYITKVAKLREEEAKMKARVAELEKIIKKFKPNMIYQ